ncbi:MAG TPA: alpha-L-arabinofuranosidase C-terminal domain-containing protein [Anaerohalosphaeraceae bacterium]|nr:alpha-L-arabinofuranosidase C-terminal domain-containing protein [Anaerohalosphaeraceae bacterium]
MKQGVILSVLLGIFILLSAAGVCQTTITISADKSGPQISPTMWGIFFEDINFNGDGGLYAELVKNRSFEFPKTMMGWRPIQGGQAAGKWTITEGQDPLNAVNPNYLRLEVQNPGEGFGLTNEGFRGIGINKGEKYYFSVFARSSSAMSLKVEVVAADGRKLLEGTLDNITGDWKNYHCLMTATETDAKATLNLLATKAGTVDLDMISLFPENSAQQMAGRPVPGLRKDVVAILAAMKPGLFRFPGGCIVEGHDLETRYQWKNTIGDINERKLIINRWNTEFKHRLTPDYFQSFGLGFYEYFLLSEQIGAEPLPILNCGMACQFNTGQLVPMDQLQPYVQDALDLIEFANGPADSEWGKKRAAMGHPEPFKMKYLGVGNEQWGPQYVERYKVFARALKEKYPEIQLVAATGSDPAIFPNGDNEVKYLWGQWRILKPEIVDEHFYRKHTWFSDNAARYDSYARNEPKVFVGEYAAMSHGVGNPDNRNNLECALAEAAFMTGLERNADVVVMTAYAPLAGHLDAWQWKPNLIWFDNLTVYGTPNYYVQKLFSTHRGDVVMPVKIDAAEGKLFVTACQDKAAGQVIIKAVNISSQPMEATVDLQGAGIVASEGQVTVLAGQPADENSVQAPTKVAPVTDTMTNAGPRFTYTFKPYSMTVLRLTVK